MYRKQNRAICKHSALQHRWGIVTNSRHCQLPSALVSIPCFIVVLLLLFLPTASSATVFQKACKGFGGITSITAAKDLCQAISPDYFMAMPASADENAAVKGLLSLFQTAILGGSRGTYSTAYTFEHGPYEGETFIVNSGGGGGTAVNGYYNDFGGSANYGSSSYVVAIDSGGWKSYLMSGLGWMCYLCK